MLWTLQNFLHIGKVGVLMFFDVKRLHLLELILEDYPHGIIVCDTDGRIVLYNQAYSMIDNLAPEKVLGQVIEKNYLMKKNESTLRMVMKTKNPQPNHRQQYTTISGTDVDVLKDTYPIIDGDDVVGAYSIVRDVYSAKLVASDVLNALVNEKKHHHVYDFSEVKFKSKKMQTMMKIVEKAQHENISIFSCEGTESKEIAFAIAKKQFHCNHPTYLNCASVAETEQAILFFGDENRKGILDNANNTTIILENIDKLTLQIQLRLKKVVQENNIILITIFNKYQNELLTEKTVNLDFFYSLNEISLKLPPLCDHKEDILVYIDLICKNLSYKKKKSIKISASAYKYLLTYHWIGNYLELAHTLSNAIHSVEEGIIYPEHLPDYIINFRDTGSQSKQTEFSSLVDVLDYTEKDIITKALETHDFNISRAAKELGISRQNLQYRMKKFSM